MLEITMKSKETSEGFSISSQMKGTATTKELKAVIKTMLKAVAEVQMKKLLSVL